MISFAINYNSYRCWKTMYCTTRRDARTLLCSFTCAVRKVCIWIDLIKVNFYASWRGKIYYLLHFNSISTLLSELLKPYFITSQRCHEHFPFLLELCVCVCVSSLIVYLVRLANVRYSIMCSCTRTYVLTWFPLIRFVMIKQNCRVYRINGKEGFCRRFCARRHRQRCRAKSERTTFDAICIYFEMQHFLAKHLENHFIRRTSFAAFSLHCYHSLFHLSSLSLAHSLSLSLSLCVCLLPTPCVDECLDSFGIAEKLCALTSNYISLTWGFYFAIRLHWNPLLRINWLFSWVKSICRASIP